jgi:pentatricopeptide repeat protein
MKYEGNLESLLASLGDTGCNQDQLTTLQESLQNAPTSLEFLDLWKQLDIHDREQLWPTLLIMTAREHPHRLLKFLGGTWVAPYPPVTMISDALGYVIFHYLDDLQPSEKSHASALVLYKAIKGLLLQGPANYAQLSQHSIFLLIQHLAKPQYIADLYHFLNQIGNPLTVHTLSHFVTKLTVDPRQEKLAYEIFKRIGDMQPDFNHASIQSLCTTVLLHSSPDMQVGHSEKFEYMLKCGLTPNIIIYNVLLLKLLKAGDTEASWQIFRMMKENGPEPDAYTMSTLLNDAKLRKDASSVSEILKFAKEKGLRAVHITTDALHATAVLMERRISRERQRAAEANEQPRRRLKTSFEVMLPYYCNYFNFKPLAHVLPGLSERYPELVNKDGFSSENVNSAEVVDEARLVKVDPGNAALVVMITALLKDYEDANTPKWFYEHLKNLIQARDPFITQLVRGHGGVYATHLYNCILMALGRHASNIPLCLQILGEMSTPRVKPDASANGTIEQPVKDEESLVPKPTSGTWGIIANMFMDHRQPRAAEKVISMMRERGMPPTRMNWGIMLKGYSRMQDTQAVVDTLDRSEREGYAPDNVTWKNIREISDRRSLNEGMRRTQRLRMKEEMDAHDRLAQQRIREDDPEPLEEPNTEQHVISDMEIREAKLDKEVNSQSSRESDDHDEQSVPSYPKGEMKSRPYEPVPGTNHGPRIRRVRAAGLLMDGPSANERPFGYLGDEEL